MTDLLIIIGILSQFFMPEESNEYEKVEKDWNKCTVREIRDELKARGLPVSGLKTELVDRLNESSKHGSKAHNKEHHEKVGEFHAFRRQYLVVFAIIMLADWMQGTHMYTLYMSYGVNVSALFLTGFLSGGIFAPFLGTFVDKFGRKRSCIVYCLLEIAINVMEGYDNFTILLIGRIMGGISTNLLFSSFESWMTAEHRKHGFPDEWLSSTYSKCSIINGSTAVLAGIVAQFLEDYFGHIGPFYGAVGLTTLALILVAFWPENYGEHHDHSKSSLTHQFIEGWKTTMSDSHILRIGSAQALSEGAMYTFVFMWVPTLLSLNPPGGVPTGCVFSSLMMAITIGGLLASPLQSFISKVFFNKEKANELSASLVYALAGLSMAVPVMCLNTCQHYVISSFLVVEFCVGLFMPIAGTLRSKYVPDNLQGAILNIFRLPLNILVVMGTRATEMFEADVVFKLVSVCFFAAAALQATMIPSTTDHKKKD